MEGCDCLTLRCGKVVSPTLQYQRVKEQVEWKVRREYRAQQETTEKLRYQVMKSIPQNSSGQNGRWKPKLHSSWGRIRCAEWRKGEKPKTMQMSGASGTSRMVTPLNKGRWYKAKSAGEEMSVLDTLSVSRELRVDTARSSKFQGEAQNRSLDFRYRRSCNLSD